MTANKHTETQPGPGTVYCFRAHRVTPLLMENYRKFVDEYGKDRVYVLADETGAQSEWPSEMNVLRLTEQFLDANRLFRQVPKLGWRCGDYFYYVALQNIDFDWLWLIESDVYFDYPVLSDFFAEFEDNPADFISHRIGRREADWYWHRSMSDLGYQEVYGSLFPLTRVSRDSAEFLFTERQYVSSGFAAGTNGGSLYPNDEAFTASVLLNTRYSMQSLVDTHPDAFDLFKYNDKYRLPDAISSAPSPKVIHSALYDKEYRQYVEDRVLKQLSENSAMERAISGVYKRTEAVSRESIDSAVMTAVHRYLEKIYIGLKP